MLATGMQAPNFTLDDSDKNPVSLSSLLGKWVVLYFYPRDDTPGCTTEAMEFSAMADGFKLENAVIAGISRDTCESHCSFRDKHNLSILLLSDPLGAVIETYGAWGEKNNYGKVTMGTIRSTILINPQGEIAKIWRNVKAQGHAQKVYESLADIKGHA